LVENKALKDAMYIMEKEYGSKRRVPHHMTNTGLPVPIFLKCKDVY
jgi:hypothetical protein